MADVAAEPAGTEIEGGTELDDGIVDGSDSHAKPNEGSGEGEGSAAEPAVQYVTREALDQSMSGLSQEMRRQMEYMQQMLVDRGQNAVQQQQQQPKPQDEFPDYHRFETEVLNDPRSFYDLVRSMRENQGKNIEATQRRIAQLENELRTRDTTERYYNYIQNQTNAAIEQYPLLKDERVQEVLKGQIAAHLSANNGDLQKVDIPKIAKDFAALVDGLVESRVQAAATKADTSKLGTPRGSPSMPGKPAQTGDVSSWEDFERGIDAIYALGESGE